VPLVPVVVIPAAPVPVPAVVDAIVPATALPVPAAVIAIAPAIPPGDESLPHAATSNKHTEIPKS
jgi:hypothetical protein